MHTARFRIVPTAVVLGLGAFATGLPAAEEGPQITIYNQDFALVREVRTLRLKEGENQARLGGVAGLLEPESVVLRDRQDPKGLRVLAQRHDGDPLSRESLLRRSEGKVVAFLTLNPVTGKREIVSGRVLRSGTTPGPQGTLAPIVEVDGKIQFSLPGEPLFDAPGADALLGPALEWELWAARAGERALELSYLTTGVGWRATYNAVTSEKGDRFDLAAWVTLTNSSGASWDNARVRLMAGDVARAQSPRAKGMVLSMESAQAAPGEASERSFDDYHLYTLPRPISLRDGEPVQFELFRGADVPASRLYIYDGAMMAQYMGWDPEMARTRPDYGTEGGTRVATMLEFTNSRTAGLGMPMPRGTIKVYRADADGSRQFIGESPLGHTAENEKVRLLLGNAFDLAGERRQTGYRVDAGKQSSEESFELKLRNHKKEPVEVRVVEHLYRWSTWKVLVSSDPFEKLDARTIEFRVKIPPDGEKTVTYQVRYTW
jgi:hypothetical protein